MKNHLTKRSELLSALLLALLTMTAAADLYAEEAPDNAEIAPLDPLMMKLAPGEWREYRFTGGATKGSVVRWTWLETEDCNGETCQWFETLMNQNDQRLVSRILGSLDDPTAVPLSVIIQTGDMPPREMPAEMRQMSAPALKRNLLNPPVRLQEPATIEVAAGKFTTDVYESTIGGDKALTYYSPNLPGMIVYEASAGGMELTAFGSDGTTSIEGEIINYTPLPPGVTPKRKP